MRVAEVEEFQGVGRGLTHLIRMWKRVEKSKTPRIKAIRGAPGSASEKCVLTTPSLLSRATPEKERQNHFGTLRFAHPPATPEKSDVKIRLTR